MSIVRKTFTVERKTIDAEAGIYEAMISTEGIDRDGDVILAAGVAVDNYLKNPVVLFGHQYNSVEAVVGKATEVERLPGKGVRARWQFAGMAENPKADMVRRLWAGEFLNATSIGFIPRKAQPRENGTGVLFEEVELLEFSIVPVPANSDALRLAVKGLDGAPSDEVLERVLGLTDQGEPVQQKRGRVLSAANEQKIRDAVTALNEVLAQLEAPADEGDKSAEVKAAIPPHTTPMADPGMAWDGPAVMADCPNDRAKLRLICAWVDDKGDPDAKQSYKFPHHQLDGKVVLRGVNNAMARLEQSDIPSGDVPGVRKHLEHHQQQFDEAKASQDREEVEAVLLDLTQTLTTLVKEVVS